MVNIEAARAIKAIVLAVILRQAVALTFLFYLLISRNRLRCFFPYLFC